MYYYILPFPFQFTRVITAKDSHSNSSIQLSLFPFPIQTQGDQIRDSHSGVLILHGLFLFNYKHSHSNSQFREIFLDSLTLHSYSNWPIFMLPVSSLVNSFPFKLQTPPITTFHNLETFPFPHSLFLKHSHSLLLIHLFRFQVAFPLNHSFSFINSHFLLISIQEFPFPPHSHSSIPIQEFPSLNLHCHLSIPIPSSIPISSSFPFQVACNSLLLILY